MPLVLANLSDVLASQGETKIVCLAQQNGLGNNWLADDDYFLRQVMLHSSGACDITLSTDNYPPGGTGLFQISNKVKVGGVLASAESLSGSLLCPMQRTRIPKGQKVYINGTQTSLTTAVMVLETLQTTAEQTVEKKGGQR